MSDSSDQIYSMAHLTRSIKQNEPTAFLFFWGRTSRDVAQIGKECLSQWYRRAFLLNGLSFPTAEHWMMYEKARLFQDERIMLSMLDDENPVVAKKLGRQIRGFDEETWNREKGRIVFEGNLHKFSQNPELTDFLFSTGDRVLVEASPDDSIRGIGLNEQVARSTAPDQWPGENLLGFALMRVRYALRMRIENEKQ
ncbi:MAG: DUF1768 domain-containing protein [Spirochaetae bacterium HGW-Spirochaetae-10]|nr:MAG: DUF1768 domain-containing protein [Spirochaetae bacterium HGW-Spirochaetae-10]